MDAQMLDATLKTHLTEMRQRLDQATGIAQTALACADGGNIEKAIEVALESSNSFTKSTPSSTPRA